MNVVVVGYGMAGARLVSHLHARAPEAAITVLGAEPHAAYNRILLSNVVAGRAGESDVRLTESAGRGVRLRLGVAAVALDPSARTVTGSDGETVAYDRLVLATGAEAVLPPIKGLVRDDGSLPQRVASFRTLDDCRRILGLSTRAGSALVLGGGLLGLEAARGLASRGLVVTVLHPLGHLMERQLDPPAGAVLATSLAELGVRVVLDASTVAVESGPDRVEATVSDGRRLDADLLVVACGVRPCIRLAESAGLGVDRGVLVDDRLRTTDRHIYAIGDCAQHAGTVNGLVAAAWEQARVVADIVTGNRPLARYAPRPPVTRLKAPGIDLAAMGDSTSSDGDVVTFADPARGTYAKLIVRGDRLAGAIMLGDNPTVGQVIQLFDRGGRVPSDPRSLLLGRTVDARPAGEPSPALIPDAAVICQCNTVTKGSLVRCWQDGARSGADLVAGTRAGTGCGSCRDAIDGIASWLEREGSWQDRSRQDHSRQDHSRQDRSLQDRSLQDRSWQDGEGAAS
jgi:assimilatory nitrate reductase electron transfer subunit